MSNLTPPFLSNASPRWRDRVEDPLRLEQVEARDIWQARVNEGWRFYFRIQGNDTYELVAITAHPK